MHPASPSQKPALMLTGPTGIGKTELAVELAGRKPVEIISADSMQLYRGMEIGTAQPTPQERQRARFHLCGVLEPDQGCNARQFLEMCDSAHRRIAERGHWPVYVGGTGMYLRALRWGLIDRGAPDPSLRRRLEQLAAREGTPTLHQRLARLDPRAARRIDPNDRVRLVRALELCERTGGPLSALQTQWARPHPRFPHLLVVLYAPRSVCHERIARRTDAMLARGWIEEVDRLLQHHVEPGHHGFKALGYQEIARYLEGELDRHQLRDRIVHRTRQFARRQVIWFRRERPAIWLSTHSDATGCLAERLQKLLEMLEKLYL